MGHYKTDNVLQTDHVKHLPDGAISLYGHLSMRANSNTGLCWPTITGIAEGMNRTRQTVRKNLGLLIDYGLIEIVEHEPKTIYRVVPADQVPVGGANVNAKEWSEIIQPSGQKVTRTGGQKSSSQVVRNHPEGGQKSSRGWSESDHKQYEINKTNKQDESSTTTTYSRDEEIEKQAWALLRQWESALFQTHGGCVTEKAKTAYLDFLKAHIENGSPPTIEQLNLAAEKALAWWQQTGSAGRNSSPGFVLTELKAILYPAPENQNGTSTNGNGRGTSNGHSARTRNGRGPVDYEAQSIAEQRRKDQWVIQKYGVSRANDIDVREAVAREAAWEARERSANGAVPGAAV